METRDIEKIVVNVIEDVAGIGGLALDQKLKEDCGLDSLSLVAVIVGIEDKTGVAFDDGDLDPAKLITIEDLVDLVWKSV